MNALGLLLQVSLVLSGFQDPAASEAVAEEAAFDPSAAEWPLPAVVSYAYMQLGIPFEYLEYDVKDKVLPRPPEGVSGMEFRRWLEKALAAKGIRLCSFGVFFALEPGRPCAWIALDTAPYVPPAELASYRGLETIITTVVKTPEAAGPVAERLAERFPLPNSWIRAMPGQPVLWIVGPAEAVRSTVEEIAGQGAIGHDRSDDGPATEVPGEGSLCVQFDEVEGTPLVDVAALAKEVLHRPVQVEPAIEDMRLRFVGAFELEPIDFRDFLEAALAVNNVIVIESEEGLKFGHRRSNWLVADEQRMSLAVPVERAQLDAERRRWRPIRTQVALQHADAAAVRDLLLGPRGDFLVDQLRVTAANNTVELTGRGFPVWRTVRVLEEIDRLCGQPSGR